MNSRRVLASAIALSALAFIRGAAQEAVKVPTDEVVKAFERGGPNEAAERYAELKKGLPAGGRLDSGPIFQAAIEAFKAGKRPAAVGLLEKIKELSPEETGIPRVLGQLYWYMEQRDLSVANFKECLETNPNDKIARQYWDLLFFIPEEFQVPEVLETEHLRLRPLRAADVDLDYKAVMGSRAHLRGTFGPDDDWPTDDLTRDDDLWALKKHEKEFLQRTAFTYTVMNPDRSECLGCVYILPAHTGQYDAAAYLWVTEEAFQKGYDRELYEGVKGWLKKAWPFPSVAFPGREIDWAVWETIQY